MVFGPIPNREYHEGFMREAIGMAEFALASDETPVGCVFVHEGQIIGRGINGTNASLNVSLDTMQRPETLPARGVNLYSYQFREHAMPSSWLSRRSCRSIHNQSSTRPISTLQSSHVSCADQLSDSMVSELCTLAA